METEGYGLINKNPKNIFLYLADNIHPEYRYDNQGSFDDWQNSARKKLKELLGINNIQNCADDFRIFSNTEFEDYTDTYCAFQSEPDYYVPCHVLMPKNVSGNVPVMLCLQGHSTGMHISVGQPIYEGDEKLISEGDRNYAQLAAQKGFCAVAIEQRYMGECGGTKEGPGCLSQWSTENVNAMAALLYGRTAIGERVFDVSKAIDVLIKNFDGINAEDITVTGNSGGGTTAFYAACLDERIKYAVPSCSVCTFKDSIINLIHCGCNYVPSIACNFDMCDLAGLIAPRKLIIVAGKEDVIFPIDGVKKTYDFAKKLYKYANAENNIDLVVGDGGHRYYAKDTFDALHRMRNR